MNNIWRILKHVSEFKLQMMFAALIGSATVGSSVGLMMTSAYMISKAALHPSIAELAIAIVGVRLFGITRGVFRYFERLITHKVTFNISAKLRVWFYESVEPLAPKGLINQKCGDLLKRIVCDVESVELVFSKLIAPPLIAFFISILTTFVMFFFDPIIALTTFCGLFIAGVALPFISMIVGSRYCREISLRQAQINNLALDYAQGMPELVAYGLVEDHKQQITVASEELIEIQHKNSNIVTIFEHVVTAVMYVTVFVLMLIVVPLVLSGSLNGVLIACVLLGTMASFEAVQPLSSATHFVEQVNSAAGELLEMLESAVDEPISTIEELQTIEMKDINFQYEQSELTVLDKFNMSISRAEALFIVGQSGVGKSSIINLIFKFWNPSNGSILFDSIDQVNLDQDTISKYVSALGQKTYLFTGTIRENMLIADSNLEDEKIWQALEQSAIADFVRQQPDGLDTFVGEHGTSFSSGEQRRIAIARTLLRDTPFVFFDEPTAGLDTQTAEIVMNNLLKLKEQNKGVVIITHDNISPANNDCRIMHMHSPQV